MIAALGHCEDPACLQKNPPSSHELVRLFRCSIHCDRNLCLFHLNSHNVYYEQEKRENDVATHELESALTTYQKLFEQHIATYHELVREATTIIYHNTSTLIPTGRIRDVLSNIQTAIAMFDQELVIKCEPLLDLSSMEVHNEQKKDVIGGEEDVVPTITIQKENEPPVTIHPADHDDTPIVLPEKPRQNFVIRVPRMETIDSESRIEVVESTKNCPSSPAADTPKRETENRRGRSKSVKRLQK